MRAFPEVHANFTELPDGTEIIAVVPSGFSAWCKTFRIDAKLKDGELKSYFMKACSRPLASVLHI